MFRFLFCFVFVFALLTACTEDSKVNNRTGFNGDENLLEETTVSISGSNEDPALQDPLYGGDTTELDGGSFAKSPRYFDPNTGLLNPDFQETDLEIIKVNPTVNTMAPPIEEPSEPLIDIE